MNETKKISLQMVLCCAAAVMALLLSVLSVVDYLRASRERNDLAREVQSLRVRKEEAIARNELLNSEVKDLKNARDNAQEEITKINKIPDRLNSISKRDEEIARYTEMLEELSAEVESLKASPADPLPDAD